MPAVQILARRGRKIQDRYNVLDLSCLRDHVAQGHPTDDADLLLYFFLRDECPDTPDGTPGISYSLVRGKQVILPPTVKGTATCVAMIDALLTPPKPLKKCKPLKGVA